MTKRSVLIPNSIRPTGITPIIPQAKNLTTRFRSAKDWCFFQYKIHIMNTPGARDKAAKNPSQGTWTVIRKKIRFKKNYLEFQSATE
jgi:hypothetical protein